MISSVLNSRYTLGNIPRRSSNKMRGHSQELDQEWGQQSECPVHIAPFKPRNHDLHQNKTRWSVPELASTIRQLKEARETRKTVIKDFKLRLYAEFDSERSVWLRAVKVMAELDCLFSLAKSSASMGQPCCRPEFVQSDEAFIDFKQLRHPALSLKNDFIPNDVKLGGDSQKIVLLTGPNMGKCLLYYLSMRS